MTFIYNKLRGRIVEIFGTQKKFADALGISDATVASRLSGRLKFSQDEIIAWCNALKIEANEIGVYFFDYELSNDELERLKA
jgi:transcriptional regulator with XRE-family HTH domain